MIDEGNGRVRLQAREARALGFDALRGGGFGDEEAHALADHMLDAALCGYEYSGLPKVLNVVEFRKRRPVKGPLQLRHQTPMSAQYDGNGLNGMYTVKRAAEDAIARASAAGFAIVGVNNTWMSGRSAHYVEMIARAGLIGIHTVSARHVVAPPGATRATMGTNPIAFGFPTEGDPLLVDVGMSTLMFTDLALRVRRGEALAPGSPSTRRDSQRRIRPRRSAAPSFSSARTRASRWRSRCRRSASWRTPATIPITRATS